MSVKENTSTEKSAITLEEYAKFAATTDKYPPEMAMLCHVLGLSSEVGEVQGKLKKLLRGDFKDKAENEWKDAFVSELGDVLWYITRLCGDLEITVEDLMANNKAKLEARVAKNTIKGDGDER